MNRLFAQVRFSVRLLRKNYGLTAAVIATLMLGIGATTAIYTVVYATLLAPLPYPHPEQLVMVWSRVNGHRNGMSAGDFLDWQRQNKSFQQLAAWSDTSFNLSSQSEPEQVNGRLTSPGWFPYPEGLVIVRRDRLESGWRTNRNESRKPASSSNADHRRIRLSPCRCSPGQAWLYTAFGTCARLRT